MNDQRSSAGSSQPPLDIHVLRRLLQNPAISRELFLPVERCRWDGQRYTLGEGGAGKAPGQYTGVRLVEPDASNRDKAREKTTQTDLVGLIKSVMELRKSPQLAGVALSSEMIVGRDPGGTQRARFGLYLPPDGRFKNEVDAARETHRHIRGAMRKARFRIESPTHFDANGGFRGLLDWAGQLRLKKLGVPKILKLLGLLLALGLLALIPFMCFQSTPPTPTEREKKLPPSGSIFGTKIESNFIILLDRSSSMEVHFPKVKAEASRVLFEMLGDKKLKEPYYVDLITYDDRANSVLGGMKEVTPEVVGKLVEHLQNLKSGGGTNLRSGIFQAAQEVSQHGKKTTLIVLTDGEDSSIREMIQDKDQIRRQFDSVEFLLNSTTPRLFGATGSQTPQNDEEKQMDVLSKTFNGRFGPN